MSTMFVNLFENFDKSNRCFDKINRHDFDIDYKFDNFVDKKKEKSRIVTIINRNFGIQNFENSNSQIGSIYFLFNYIDLNCFYFRMY